MRAVHDGRAWITTVFASYLAKAADRADDTVEGSRNGPLLFRTYSAVDIRLRV